MGEREYVCVCVRERDREFNLEQVIVTENPTIYVSG